MRGTVGEGAHDGADVGAPSDHFAGGTTGAEERIEVRVDQALAVGDAVCRGLGEAVDRSIDCQVGRSDRIDG